MQKTKAIVLHTTEFSEASLVVKMYTEDKGIQSFLVNGVRKPKPKFPQSLFQPLTILEIVAYFKKQGALNRVTDVSASPPLKNIAYDTIKTTMAMFLAEVLYKSIKEEEANPSLFSFIDHGVRMLDVFPGNPHNFHLCFMMQLTRYLGFYPSGQFSQKDQLFDLQEGMFTAFRPLHPYILEPAMAEKFCELMNCSLEESKLNVIPNERKQLLQMLILYYEMHHTQGARIKSHEILSEVLG